MNKKLNIIIVGDNTSADGTSAIPEKFIDKEYTLQIKKTPSTDDNYWQFLNADTDAVLLIKDNNIHFYNNFIKILKQKKQSTPLFIAGANDIDEEIKSYKDGACAYFTLPLNYRKIIALLSSLCINKLIKNNYDSMAFTTAEVVKERDEFYKEFKNLVLLNLEKGISIEKISNEMNISSKTLTRRVKKYLFTTPAQLIIEIKLNYAKKLLAAKHFSVKKVSFMAGFNSPQRFNTVFKAQEGQTPMQFIKNKLS